MVNGFIPSNQSLFLSLHTKLEMITTSQPKSLASNSFLGLTINPKNWKVELNFHLSSFRINGEANHKDQVNKQSVNRYRLESGLVSHKIQVDLDSRKINLSLILMGRISFAIFHRSNLLIYVIGAFQSFFQNGFTRANSP